ncbi:hypothetical protein NLI96_g357 [Meripilus lineatus]|uniref:Cerato-platanin n=1 Tax=Meripilus lineatus TaxID=2056292 RepID=A0AAD5VDY3_9APHY|nr:hypothetical protein NLI96_g357 [Physisporinus lineatus]
MRFTIILSVLALLVAPLIAVPTNPKSSSKAVSSSAQPTASPYPTGVPPPVVSPKPQPPATVPVRFSNAYDKKTLSMNSVACSNGANGLLTKGYKTLGSLKVFPYIGGAAAVKGWNSPKCGSCWEITYGRTTVTILAVDSAKEGFVLSKAALDKLTAGHAAQYGVVQATAKEVPASKCLM